MTFPILLVAVLGIVALVVQGGSCLLTKDRPLSIGFLDILLAGVIAFALLSVSSGQLVLGTEFGLLMVQSPAACWLLRLALVCVAVLPALCWCRIRELNHWPSYTRSAIGLGMVIGIWSSTRIIALKPDDFDRLTVYGYDVWWPPLILWLAVCFAGAVLALIKARGALLYTAFAASLVALLGRFALAFEDLADPQSRSLWTYAEPAALVLAWFLIGYMAMPGYGTTKRLMSKIAIGLIFAFGVLITFTNHSSLARASLNVLLILPVALGVLAFIALIALERAPGSVTDPTSPNVVSKIHGLLRTLPFERLVGVVHALALPIIAFGLADIFSVGYLNKALEVTALFCFWLLFAEKLAEGTLDTLPQIFRDGVLQLAAVRRLRRMVAGAASSIRRGAVSAVRSLGTGSGWWVTAKVLLTSITVLLLLTVASELDSYQSTVVQDFQWLGDSNSADKSAATVISGGLVNALARMRRDLRTDLLLAERKSSGEHPSVLHLLQAESDSSGLGAAIPKGEDIEVAHIRIPLTFLVGPIQRLVRSVIAVRVVSGSVQRTPDGHYVALANSSAGESWRVSSTDLPSTVMPKVSGADLLSGGDRCDVKEKQPFNAVDEMIEQLAFDMASSDTSYIAAGMTTDWCAFRYFRAGLIDWQSYQMQDDKRELETAIEMFRQALHRDRKFALASYRLGLALQRSEQPGAAIVAFHESTAVNPEFLQGELAEASTLYNFSFYYPSPATSFGPLAPEPRRREQALSIWTDLVELPAGKIATSERREAYYNICSYLIDAMRSRDSEPSARQFYVPYYFCSKAANTYFRLAPSERQSADQRVLQSSVLAGIAVSLESHQAGRKPLPTSQAWSCFSDAFEGSELREDGTVPRLYSWGSKRSGAALRYFRNSLELVGDNPLVRCDVANAAAFTTGDLGPMVRLSYEPNNHFAVALDYSQFGYEAAHASEGRLADHQEEGMRASGYYRRALDELETAIEMDHVFIGAMIQFANTCWQWQADWLLGRTSKPPERRVALRAEEHAREAVRLAHIRGSVEAELVAREVLGEVLLGQGRYEEAIDRLEEALKSAAATDPKWGGLAETRWDLGQAYLCAGAAGNARVQGEFSAKALAAFDNIRTDELRHEMRPFRHERDALDVVLRGATCPDPPDRKQSEHTEFVMLRPARDAGPACGWSGVVGRMVDGVASGLAPVLHVWGNGVDDRVALGGNPSRAIQLQAEPPARHRYYFAQLEDQKEKELSPVQSFDTASSAEAGRCTRNRITLMFSHMGRDMISQASAAIKASLIKRRGMRAGAVPTLPHSIHP